MHMATDKVGVYRKYHGPIPSDGSGAPLTPSAWPQRRACRWAVRWYGADGQRYSRSFATRKEAQLFAETKQADVREGAGDPPRPVTLKEFAKMYLELRGDLTERSREEHARTLRRLQAQLGPQRLLGEVRPLDARRLLSAYRQPDATGQKRAPATVNKLLRECRRIFREALDCQLLGANPFAGIRQEKVGETGWHYVTPVEYRQLLAAAPAGRWRGMLALAYCCGLRLGELLNLTWADVDFAAARLRVVRKAAKAGVAEWTPKDKDLRIIPLPEAAVNVLTQVHAEAGEGQVYLFVKSKGPAAGQRVARANVWRDFQALRRRAGVPKCTLHDLRKSFCTNLAGSLPLHVVQELAGHADIRTTRRHYLQVRPEQLEAARRAVDEVLADVPASH
jgi:integrase/recombinase XerD